MTDTSDGLFVWHECLTEDPAAAIAFYTEVVGWKTQPFGEGGDYSMWVGSQGPLGGVMKLPEDAKKMGAPPHWFGHVQVANVDASAIVAQKLGAKVYKEPTDIPTVGRFAIIADPQGAVLSIFTPAAAMTAHDTSKEGEVCWNELLTSDPQKALAFYRDMFGWQVKTEIDMGPVGAYRVYGTPDKDLGGVMATPPGFPVPAMWVHYFATNDLTAAIERAKARGATVMHGPVEVPGGGKIANLTDPQGAVFALHQGPAT